MIPAIGRELPAGLLTAGATSGGNTNQGKTTAGPPSLAWVLSGPSRTLLTWVAVALRALECVLVVPLAARSAWRHLASREPLRYRLDLWMVIFPAGMYATASWPRAGLEPGPIVKDMEEPARHDLGAADEEDRPGDPPCLQRRVCPACGSVADEDPPATCPACGADLPGD